MSRRGNVLFLILAGIALFAALSYTVSQSMRSTGDGIDEETNYLDASQYMRFVADVKTAYKKLTALGCDHTEVSFDPTPGTGGEENSFSPADLSCHIFSNNGGGVAPPEDIHTAPSVPGWTTATNMIVSGRGSDTTGNPCPGCDLVLVYYHMDIDVCAEINLQLLGNATIHDFSPGALGAPDIYDGTFPDDDFVISSANVGGSTAYDGQFSFCIKETGGQNTWTFVNVIRSR